MKQGDLLTVGFLQKSTPVEVPVKENHKRHQQWLLNLEKEYLTLQDKLTSLDNSSEYFDRSSSSSARELVDISKSSEPSHLKIDNKHIEEVISASDATNIEVVEKPGAHLSTTKFELSNREGNGSRISEGYHVARHSHVTPKNKAMLVIPSKIVSKHPELKSAFLFNTDGGLHLAIRNVNLHDLRNSVGKIRSMFNQLGLHVSRITVNGSVIWLDKKTDSVLKHVDAKPFLKNY